MELSWLLILKIAAFLVGILAVIGFFVRLSWLMRVKLVAALLVGIIVIGILAWPLGAPSEPFGAVFFGTMSGGGTIVLAGLAFLTGFVAYFLSWPWGRGMGVLAVPAGLAVWALHSGSMAELVRLHPTAEQRVVLFGYLRWEPVIWLAIVAAGFAGVVLAQRIRSKSEPGETQKKANPKSNLYLNAVIATAGSVLMALICIRIFARDVRIFDRELGSVVVAQPTAGQIAFAVFVSFVVAGFVVKKFLDAGYIWPTIAGALITAFAISVYVKQDTLEYLSGHWPAVFFSNAVVSILPVQMVAFGTLGSIAGYWAAVRYNYWRKHG